MPDHHNEELLGLLDRIKEFVRAEVYPLEAESSVLGVSVLAQIEDKQFEVASPSFERRLKKRASQRNAEVAADQLWVSYLPASSCQLNNTNPV